ncbi:MAG: hypothetical protein ABJN42_29075 [Roseibium sp.]|uniref:hypothetical protein n=1 Tax=Roseibium sp. TaxID=1936156 RepID=UPI0032990F2D
MKKYFISCGFLSLMAALPVLATGSPSVLLPEDLSALTVQEDVSPEQDATEVPDIMVEGGDIVAVEWAGPPEASPRPPARPGSVASVAPVAGIALAEADIPEAFRIQSGDTPFALTSTHELALRTFTDVEDTASADFDIASFLIEPTDAKPGPGYLLAMAQQEKERLAEEEYQKFLQTPQGRYAVMASRELEKRYGTDVNPDETSRFFDLAEGQAERDYAFRPERLAVLQVTNDDFRMEQSSMAARRASLERLQTFIETPEGAAALARMSPKQMLALTEMMGVIEESASVSPLDPVQTSAPAPVSSQDVQASLPGVPSLSFRPDSEQESSRPEPRVRDVGSDQNLLLAGWNAGYDSQGRVVMFRGADADGGIEIEEGMIMGALGAVVDIHTDENELTIRFGSGDELKGQTG